MEKIAVTGAGGFLGSNMVTFLKEKGYVVVVIEDLDLRVIENVNTMLNGVDMVFHFAANMGGVGYFNKHNYQPFIDNMTMDLNVLRVAEKNNIRVFYPSSACAYPVDIQTTESQTPKLREDMLGSGKADQMYGWEKLMITLLAKESPVDVRVGVLNTIFGEGQQWEGEKAKFPPSIVYKVLQSKKTGRPISIWGNGNQTRTFLYIQDALEKIYEVMMSKQYNGEVNIASDEIVTVKQCADWLCEIAGIEPKYEFDLTKPSGVLARGIDNSKFNWHYKYRSQFTTKQGFERLYKWMEDKV